MPITQILLLESNVADQLALKQQLQPDQSLYGFETASSLAEATTKLSMQDFGGVVLNLDLVNEAILPWLERLKHRPIAIVVMAAGGQEDAVLELMQQGVTDYVIKDADRHYLKLLPVTLQKAIALVQMQQQLQQVTVRQQIEEQLLRAVIDTVPAKIFVKDWEGRYLLANQQAAQFNGTTPEALIGQQDTDFHLDVALVETFKQENRRVIETQQELFIPEERILKFDGTECWFQWHKRPIRIPELQIDAVLGVGINISDRKQAEAVLQNLVEGAATVTGHNFLPTLSQKIATALDARYVMISRWQGDRFITCVFWAGGQLQPNIEIDLEHSPWEQALVEGLYCCSSQLQQQFPQNPLIRSLGAESYLGIRLTNIEGNSIGTLCILDDKPLENYQRVIVILQVFAARVGAELERQEAIEALHQLNQELEVRVEERTAELQHMNQQLQQAIAERQKLVSLVENSTDFIALATPSGHMTYLNSAGRRLLGLEHITDITNLVVADFHFSEDWIGFQKTVLQALAQGESWQGEGRLRHFQTQAEIPVIHSAFPIKHPRTGGILAIATISRNITEQKYVEQQLRNLSDRLSLAVTSGGIGIWEWDIVNNEVFWDDRMYELYGLQRSDFDNAYEAWLHAIHPDDQAEAEAISLQARQGERDYNPEFRVVHSDGSIHFLQAYALIQRNEAGEAQRMIGVNFDVTDRKQTEIELAHAARLKDEFLANMSHELRTPLNAILGMAEALQEPIFGALNQQQLKAIATIEHSGKHLLDLINDILDLAKIEAGKLNLSIASHSIQALCNSSLSLVKQMAYKKNIQLNLSVSTELSHLEVDDRRMRQVLINLLSNAVKFTLDGGSVTLKVWSQKQEEKGGELQAKPRQVRQGNRTKEREPKEENEEKHLIYFSVSDTGIGIAPDDLPKLFESFSQIDSKLNRQYNGTGLGLALVKRITELHGGTVEVESTLNQGSKFTIILPTQLISRRGHGQASTATTRTQQNTANSAHQGMESESPLILLAEDNQANIETYSNYLMSYGYRLIVANNGLEAISLATHHQPNLILMDIQMPGMDGLEAIQMIRALPDFAHIPIIALTALAMPSDREKCIAVGADEYLTKPVRLRYLVNKISELLHL